MLKCFAHLRSRQAGPPIIGRMSGLPERVRLVIFDLDGVVYRGAEPVPGAPELVDFLHGVGVARALRDEQLHGRPVEAYVDRPGGDGHRATAADEIVTSTSATIEHLRRHAPEVRAVLAIGADGMEAELREAGLDGR